MKTLTQSAENQQKLVINLTSDIAKKVSHDDRRALQQAYIKLFSGLSRVNWSAKKTLGRAWQSAINLCELFIAVKSKNTPHNPALKYLSAVHKSHKKYWSRVIMLHQSRDTIINQPKSQRIGMARSGTKMIQDAINTINLILSRYNTRFMEQVIEQSAPEKQAPQPQIQKQQNVQPATPVPTQPQIAQTATAQPQAAHQPAKKTQAAQPAQQQVTRQPQVQQITKAQRNERITQSAPQMPISKPAPATSHAPNVRTAPVAVQKSAPQAQNNVIDMRQKIAVAAAIKPAAKTATATQAKVIDMRPKFTVATQRVNAKIQFQIQRKIQMSVFQRVNQNYKVA